MERGRANGNQRVERGRERLVGSEKDRIHVFPVLPHAVVLIEQGKSIL